MFYFSFHQTLPTVFISVLLLLSSCNAAFVPSIVRRQGGTGVQTFNTTQQIPTEAGVFTQTCTVVITPITGANGEGLFKEVKTCTMSMNPDSGGGPSNGVVPSSVLGGGTSTTTLTLTSTFPNSGTYTSVPPTGISTEGVSSVPTPSPTAIPSSATPPSGSTNTSALSSSGTPATAAAESSTQTPFDPPGKSLQVLPIGLGVFGGISVIAIVVVGIVTYERTKHRRNFRNRKLAEAGAEMGYGGNAQAA